MTQIAVIGWGRMGGAMGPRLIDAGYEVVAFDTAGAAKQRAEAAGAGVAASAAGAVGGSDFTITMLPTPASVEEAALAEDGVAGALAEGTTWMEMSSSHPDLTLRLAALARESGAAFVDAPVSGGVRGARAGELTIIVGAPPGALERARAVLEVLGKRIVHVGERPGDGDLAKTINNMLSAANLAVAAEGVALARAGGLELAPLLEVLNGSTGASNATHKKIPDYVLTESYDAGFTIGQYVKDLRIALDFARDRDVPADLLEQALVVWMGAVEHGLGDADHTRIVPYVSERLGVDRTDH